jgi:CRP-like cAMP-binding protein
MTVQGRPSSRLWLITQGEALVSANARPLRVAGYGDAIGLTSMLLGGGSPDTTIALGTMRALAASPDRFRELIGRPAIRERLVAAVPTRRRRR